MECLFDADKLHYPTWLWIHNEYRWGRSMSTVRPEKPEAAPLYTTKLGLGDLANHLIAKHLEHVNILSLSSEHGADVNGRGVRDKFSLQ